MRRFLPSFLPSFLPLLLVVPLVILTAVVCTPEEPAAPVASGVERGPGSDHAVWVTSTFCMPQDPDGNLLGTVEVREGDTVSWSNPADGLVTLRFPAELFGVEQVPISAGGTVELTVLPGTAGNTYPYGLDCGSSTGPLAATLGAPDVKVGQDP